MRIVFMNTEASLGGAEQCLLDAVTGLRAALPDAEPRVILLGDGPLVGRLEKLKVAVTLVPMPERLSSFGESSLASGGELVSFLSAAARAAGPTAAYLLKLSGALRHARPDLIHSNGIKTHLLSRLVAPAGVPLVWHLHDFVGNRAASAHLLAATVRRAAMLIANSRAVASDAEAIFPRTALTTIHNGVDTSRFSPAAIDPAWLDDKAGLSDTGKECLRVGLVATFANWKGHDLFLEAAARLSSSLPVRFFIVGGAIYRTRGSQISAPSLRTRARDLGLTGRLGIVDFLTDPVDAYRSLDVVVHASTRPEPFGRTIVEAMACGRPVIASREGGAVELFDEEREALAFTPRDPQSLASAMQRLIVDESLRMKLAQAGRARVLRDFTSERYCRELAQTYLRVLRRSQ